MHLERWITNGWETSTKNMSVGSSISNTLECTVHVYTYTYIYILCRLWCIKYVSNNFRETLKDGWWCLKKTHKLGAESFQSLVESVSRCASVNQEMQGSMIPNPRRPQVDWNYIYQKMASFLFAKGFFFSNLGYPKPSNGCSIKNIPTQPISEGFSDLGVLHDLRCWLKKPSEISPPATCRIPLIPRSAPCVEAPHVVPTALRKPLAPKGSIFHHKKALPVPIVCSWDFSTSQL